MRSLWLMLSMICAVVLVTSGCASSQARPSKVGEIGLNSAYERALAAEMEASRKYDYTAPKTGAFIRSEPPGATVEWLNRDGQWVVVGTTPTKQIVIEATGKPELFRLSRDGFITQTHWLASTGSRASVEAMFELQPDLPYGYGTRDNAR